MTATAFEIKQYDEKAKRYHFLAMINAATPAEAKLKFIERVNYKPRDGFVLFVKSPGCL
jgi:hypothetical protein